MPNIINKSMLAEYERRFSALDGAIFVKFEKHAPAQDRELRKSLRKQNVAFRVVKNRIVRRAIGQSLSKEALRLIKGPTAILYGDVEQIIAGAKVLDASRRAKSAPGIEVRGAYLQGAVLSPEQVRALTLLPAKKELYALVLGAVTGTAANVPSLAQSMLAVPVRLVAALIEKLEAADAPAAPAA